jgi:hypothetical protein
MSMEKEKRLHTTLPLSAEAKPRILLGTSSSDSTMKAFIVYADFASAANANATLRRVGARAGVRVRWIIKCRQVNVLREPGPFENALIEAADAHLILLAERHSQFIPSWICEWLKRWAVLRQIQDAALAVMSDGTSLPLPVHSELVWLAQQLGLNVITGDGATVKAVTRGGVLLTHEQALRFEGEGPRFAESVSKNSYRFIGINE